MFDLQGYGKVLWQGTQMTIKLGLVSLAIGLLLGLAGAAMKSSRFAFLRTLASFYTTVVRGVPELLFILFVYLGGSVLLQAALLRFGRTQYVEISQFWAGVLALSVMFGAYATEVFRMALCEIPKGQWEAAQSVGMRPLQIFWRIILPQMWAVSLPGLGNLALVLLKDTALVSVIGLRDLMYFAQRAAQTTQQTFTFYMAAALIYLALTVLVMAFVAWAEYMANPAKRYARRAAKTRSAP